MNQRSFINQLTDEKSNYQYSSQAEDQANSLDTISDDIYSESERFIYELIQNADDACKDKHKGVAINIEFTKNFIIVSHTGREFSEKDIRSLSSVGKSQKTENSNQTGYKGIGFKSVFGKSDCVYINSNGFCFRFDKSHWQNKGYRMPWQIIPVWSDDLPEELKNSYSFKSNDFPVATAIKYHNTQSLKEDLFRLFSNTQIMLFLRNVKSITVNSANEFIVEKIKSINYPTVLLKKNGQTHSEWIIKEFTLPIDESIQEQLKRDEKSPKKLQQSKNTTISFAAKIQDSKLVAIKEYALIFTYLPTKINLGFPFLVNADFLTNAPREGFHEDRIWNQWLFKQVAKKLFEWLGELAKDPNYKLQIASLIPEKFPAYETNPIKREFNQGFDEAIKNTAFIPSKNDGLLKVSEALIDNTDIQEVVGNNLLIQYYNQQHEINLNEKAIVNKKVEAQKKLVKIGVKSFEIKDLKSFFSSDLCKSNIGLEKNYELIKFLHKKATDTSNSELWRENLQSLPFILDQNKVLSAPDKPIYLPAETLEISIGTLKNSFNFINSEILQKLKKDEAIYNWLCNDLNITKPTQHNIIEKTIIPNICSLTDTSQKSLEVVRYLFEANRKGQLQDTHLNKLSATNLITKNDGLARAKSCYLSDKYKPEILLDSYLDKKYILSEIYIDKDDNILEWNVFFNKIGVNQNINFRCDSEYISYSKLLEQYPDYVEYVYSDSIAGTIYAPYTYQHGFENFITATFIEKISEPNFAKIFWRSVIEHWSDFKQVLENKTNYWVWNRTRKFSVLTYLEYFVRYKSCIPTTTGKCYESNQVIINREEFKEIAGNFLPVLDLGLELTKELDTFLKFRQEISLDEYLDTLKNISEQTYKTEDLPKVIKRIGLIYDALSKWNLKHETDKIRQWGETYTILASDDKFYTPKDLYYIAINNFEPSANIENFVKLPYRNQQTIETIELLKTLGVNIIAYKNLIFEPGNPVIEETELRDELHKSLPLIVLVSAIKSHQGWEAEFNRLSKLIEASNFYKASELLLKFEQDEKEIIKQKRKAWSDQNQLYYTDNWRSARTLYSLTDVLCNFLKIKDCERELNVLLLESFKNGLEWLKEQEYDTTLIPVEYLEIKDESLPSSTGITPTDEQDSRTNEQKEFDRITGEIGEQYVYNELKRIFIEKYKATESDIEETQKGFKLKKIEVIWENKICESGESYDFQIIESFISIDNLKPVTKYNTSYIEAKSTTTDVLQGDKVPLKFSHKEWDLMYNTENRYFLARVFSTRTNPYMKLVKMEKGEL